MELAWCTTDPQEMLASFTVTHKGTWFRTDNTMFKVSIERNDI